MSLFESMGDQEFAHIMEGSAKTLSEELPKITKALEVIINGRAVEPIVLSEEDKAIAEAFDKVDRDVSAEYMAELLMDDGNSSYKMFEELASLFAEVKTAEARKAINDTVSILTGWKLSTIALTLLEKNDKEDQS